MFLRKSTAVTLRFGPFVDNGDGFTPETALTIARADVRLSKAGGAFAQKTETTSATHDENGWYSIPLDATDTGTVGTLRIAIYKTGALPVWQDFDVVEQNIFDLLTLNNNTAVVQLKSLRLFSDDGTIPLDIDAGATCGTTAMRVRAQRANQTAFQIVGPGGTGSAFEISIASGAANALKITAGASGGSAVTINAPGTGSSRALDIQSAGDIVTYLKSNGGGKVLSLVGGAVAVVELDGSSSASGDIVHIKSHVSSTKSAIKVENGKYGIELTGINDTAIQVVNVAKALRLVSTGTDAVEVHSSIAKGIAVRGETKAFELSAPNSGGVAIDVIGNSKGLRISGTDAVDVSGTANAFVVNAGTGYAAYVRGAAGYGGIDIGISGSGNAPGIKIRGLGTGLDIDAREIGLPLNLGDGASLAAMLTSLAGKTASAASYDRATDSQEAIKDAMASDVATQTTVLAIKAKTDNLPASPANETTSLAIKAKTDNLPASPANEVTVAAIKVKTDTLPASPANEVTVAAIKVKTDNLPASPANENTSLAIKAKTDALPPDPASESNVTAVGGAVVTVNGKIGIPSDLGSGATIADNLVDVDSAASGAAAIGDVKDLIFNRDVITRHANQKPSQYTAGTGANQVVVNTVQDGNGNTETESIAP